MAVETERARLGADSGDTRRRSLPHLTTGGRVIRSASNELVGQLADAAARLRTRAFAARHLGGVGGAGPALAGALAALADPRRLLERLGPRAVMVSGPFVRFFTRTLQRRIILANTIGLA